MPFVTNPAINFIIIALVISGGLGFTVWIELFEIIKTKPVKDNLCAFALIIYRFILKSFFQLLWRYLLVVPFCLCSANGIIREH